MSTIQSFIISATNFFSGIWQQSVQNFDLEKLIKGVIIYFLVVWAAFIIWVIKDITNRSTSILVQAFSILIVLVLTPIFGLPIYLLLRPGTTLGERYYEETAYLNEENEAEAAHICHQCEAVVDREFRFCPECGSSLLLNCFGCKALVRPDWKACPYCGISDPLKSHMQAAASAPVIDIIQASVFSWEDLPCQKPTQVSPPEPVKDIISSPKSVNDLIVPDPQKEI